MKVISLQTALKRLPTLNNEIRYRSCFEEEQFTSGLIAFRPNKSLDAKQIIHADKDVVCHVLKGRGRLRINGRRIQLRPGIIFERSSMNSFGTCSPISAKRIEVVVQKNNRSAHKFQTWHVPSVPDG